jgi:ABC-type transport system involved in multi-copper enzyme maturation permease subunit
VWNVARDVLGEAFARKYMIAIFGLILAGLLLLGLALDLEVVDGALAASKLFGQQAKGQAIIPVDVAMRPVFTVLSYAVFYLGLAFGVLATADIAPKMLRPGRVELLLSLPVRRYEVVLGTYLGVLIIALLGTTVAIGGASGILFFKAEFFTSAPLYGAAAAVLGFAVVYAAMLLVATVVRSAAASAGAGFALTLISLLTDDRAEFLSWFRNKIVRGILEVVITPLPKLLSISTLGQTAAVGDPITFAYVAPLVGSAVLFGACCVAGAIWVVTGKDY